MPGALPGGGIDEGGSHAGVPGGDEAGPTGMKFHKKINDLSFTLYLFVGDTDEANPTLDYENDKFAWVGIGDLGGYKFVPRVREELVSVLGAVKTRTAPGRRPAP